MPSSFDGKVYAITGGASGIGLVIAKILHSKGAKLSIADINTEQLSKAVTSLKEFAPSNTTETEEDSILSYPLNVRSSSEVETWIKKTVERFGRLDGAANFAGIISSQHGNTIEEQDEGEWERVLGVNLTGLMHCLKFQLSHLSPGSSIVNAASINGLLALPGSAAYGVSKHGVIGLTKIAARDCGDKGVRVNAVAPGYIDTPMLAESVARKGESVLEQGLNKNVPMGRKASAEEVANVVVFLLSEEASYVTGQVWSVDGGWNS